MCSFVQSWHGRDQLGSRSSTKSGASTSGMEDGGVVGPGPGSGSVRVVRKEKQAQSQTSTRHSAGLSSPSVLLGSPLACPNGPTTLASVASPSPPALAQPGYHKAQMKQVLEHARAELMEEVRNCAILISLWKGEFLVCPTFRRQ